MPAPGCGSEDCPTEMQEGWLQAPDGREVRRYHRDPESPGRNPTIWIDHGLAIPGEPALLKRGVCPGQQC